MSIQAKLIRGRARKEKKDKCNKGQYKNGLNKLFPIDFKGPLCRLCRNEYSPYDKDLCVACSDSIERLKDRV